MELALTMAYIIRMINLRTRLNTIKGDSMKTMTKLILTLLVTSLYSVVFAGTQTLTTISVSQEKYTMKLQLIVDKKSDIKDYLDSQEIPYQNFNETDLFKTVADDLKAGKVIGWFQGAMEFGPRSLGGRSILGDPRNPKMQSIMNLKIKLDLQFQ